MLKDLLVGSTGFVGQNIMAEHAFQAVCHSTNVSEHYGSRPDLCVYCGVPAAMYLANENPAADFAVMEQARENLRKIAPAQLVLVSTIAVYADSRGKDENSEMVEDGLSVYGKNRLILEKWTREDFPDALIVRLPALYGRAMKKNFLYDLHTIIPFMLRENKFAELKSTSPLIEASYTPIENGFCKLKPDCDRAGLYQFFSHSGFNALAFTDSRSRYQFYHLKCLWNDIQTALRAGIKLLNIAVPTLSAQKIYKAVTGKTDWRNEISPRPFDYDMRTVHDGLFGGNDGYLMSAEEELADICRFMAEWKA